MYRRISLLFTAAWFKCNERDHDNGKWPTRDTWRECDTPVDYYFIMLTCCKVPTTYKDVCREYDVMTTRAAAHHIIIIFLVYNHHNVLRGRRLGRWTDFIQIKWNACSWTRRRSVTANFLPRIGGRAYLSDNSIFLLHSQINTY